MSNPNIKKPIKPPLSSSSTIQQQQVASGQLLSPVSNLPPPLPSPIPSPAQAPSISSTSSIPPPNGGKQLKINELRPYAKQVNAEFIVLEKSLWSKKEIDWAAKKSFFDFFSDFSLNLIIKRPCE